jgi:beta-galactosidase
LEAFYRGTFASGVSARLLHDEQLVGPNGLTPAEVAAELPVLIVPGLLVADDGLLDWLRSYAAAGGHLVIGPRTAYGDAEGRARVDVKPGRLADAAGVRYQEFSNLDRELGVVSVTDDFDPSPGAAANDWADGLISEGAKVVLGYDHPHFGRFPAVVTTGYQSGRITTVGTLPNESLAADLLRWLVPGRPWPQLPPSVTVHSATNRAGRRIHVVHNWSWDPVRVELPEALTDLLADDGGKQVGALDLDPWDVRVLAAR